MNETGHRGVRLLLIGPPGAGKGTQAACLASKLGVPAVSTGDIFRDNVANETELGRRAKAYLDSGEYVPDGLTNSIVRHRLHESDAARGFLLDGYPRTIEQVAAFDAFLETENTRLDAVIQLRADAAEVVARLHKRAREQGRPDDTGDVIRRRLALYEKQTAPLIEVYSSRGLVVSVDALGPIDDVTERILRVLDERGVDGARRAPHDPPLGAGL